MPRAGSAKQDKKKKTSKRIEIDCLRVISIILAVYFVGTLISQQLSMNEYDVKIADLKSKIDAANNRVEEINELKGKVNTTEFIETVARTELGLVKPYEKIFIDVNK